jgi:hypothetical protein
MGLMAALVVIVLLGLAWVSFTRARPDAQRAASAPKRTSGPSFSPYWWLGAALLALVLLRFGGGWLVAAGGIVAAAARAVAPLMRLLHVVHAFRGATGSSRAGPAGAGAPTDGQGPMPPRPQRMTRREALEVFGLDESATHEDVQREYRRLMRKIHPDLGGSSYLAAKLNEAKDVLT